MTTPMPAAVKSQLKWGPVKVLTSEGVWTENPGPASTDDSESRKEKLRRGKREAKEKGNLQ